MPFKGAEQISVDVRAELAPQVGAQSNFSLNYLLG